jgi:MFS transporter, DHA2 family, methylenomycin A resistance protein
MASLHRRIALATVCAGYFMVILDTTALTPALPVLRGDLGGGISTLQWVVDGYALTFAALLLSGGALGDQLGARGVFAGGALLFAATSAACAAAPDAESLVGARMLQGVAAALLVPTSLALLRASFTEPAARARAVGAWGGIAGVAAAGGPVVGGVLAQAVGWRAVFLLNVPIGAAAALLSARHVAAPPPRRGRGLDVPGQIAAVVALGALTLALIDAGRSGWDAAGVRVGAAGFLVALAAFVAVERRTRAPVLPPSLFASPALTAATAVGLLINLGFYGQLFVVNLLLQDVRGLDPLEAGLALLPEGILVSLGSLLSGRLTARAGSPRPTMLLGLGLGAAGMAGLAVASAGAPYLVLVAPLMAAGVGMSLTMPAATSAVVESAPHEHVGVAAGVLNAARQVGGLVGVALLGTLVAGGLAGGAPWALAASAAAFAVAALLALASGGAEASPG